jgi:hypothetical protein
MREDKPTDAIPAQWASELCGDICEESRGKWYSLTRLLCWQCHFFSKGNPTKKCFCRRADNRGCALVNTRQMHYYWAFHG